MFRFYNVVRLLLALSIFMSYAIPFYIPINFIWSILQPKLTDRAFFHKFGEYFLKMFFHVIIFAFVVAVPHLESIIALIGALFNTPLAIALPALLDIILCHFLRSYESLPPIRRPLWLKLKIFKNCFIVFLGTAGTVVGTLVTVVRIVRVSINF
ncbi:hypothetical protein HELRODRAFT_182436 [Helobdella robusta]|uniref:Amino acid transporter transmembrane domain-containing protein n=1 Tax=Helobdella robusta TaxID=6412 RepID=T1FI71_HELRO|nr:hypothetical protein HELRODRAFT_182436 [Helobdella robusta]ESN90963.1 hypothetical protein HELRODRAFT_182436 [Helobdella robusta]